MEFDMQELVRTLRGIPRQNLAKMLLDHTEVDGHCPVCRSVSPCTLWTAAKAARTPGSTKVAT